MKIKHPSLRDWYDPWLLIGEMIFFLSGAITILILDLVAHFMGTMTREHVMVDFKERMIMVYTTVPFYLRELKIAEAYNRKF